MTDAQKLSLGDALARLEAWRLKNPHCSYLISGPLVDERAIRSDANVLLYELDGNEASINVSEVADLPAAVTRAIESFKDGGK